MTMEQLDKTCRHTISLFVANKPGVLLRICLVFSRRGFNIESLVVSPAIDGRFSRMTITAQGDAQTLDQIIRQCAKLVDVVHASAHAPEDAIEKEFALLKVTMPPEKRVEILQIIQHVEGHLLDFSAGTVVFSLVGKTETLDNCIELLRPYGITEMVRSGKMVITKGATDV